MTKIEEMRDDYDWKEAFYCAGVDFDAVDHVIASDEGENDDASWIALLWMKNGTYCFLTSWCDYTGWDCRSGGDAYDSEDLVKLLLSHVPEEDRARLGYVVSADGTLVYR